MARSSSLAGSPSSKKSWPAWGRSPTASVEVSALSLRKAVQVLLRPTSTASRLGAKSLSEAAPVRNATVTDGLVSEPASVQTAATMTSAGTPSRSVGPLTVSVWFAASKSRVASPVVTPGKPAGATGRTTDVPPAAASARAVCASSYVIPSMTRSPGPLVPITWTDQGAAAWVLPTPPSSRKPTAHSRRTTHPTGCCRTRDLTNA